jgi:UDP-N-acetylmuramyl pentapeptide phosphotransferase/UDP-N-acetylglucosamine-1-phosphate transferase
MTIMVLLPAAAAAYLLLPSLKSMLEASGALRTNFLGKSIPTGLGIAFVPAAMAGGLTLMFLEGTDRELLLLFTFGVTVMGFAGIIDDLLGGRSVKGIQGHIGCLAAGELTTGALKAIFGTGAAAVISAYISSGKLEWIVNLIIIALFTNLLNLMDLRPGRAVKSFFFLWGVSYFLKSTTGYAYLMLPLAGCLIAYLPLDVKGKGMMGDSGSNALGIAMGIYYCLCVGLNQKIVIMAALALLQLVFEKYSFTGMVNKSRILRFLDGFGTGGIKKIDD